MKCPCLTLLEGSRLATPINRFADGVASRAGVTPFGKNEPGPFFLEEEKGYEFSNKF